MTTIKTLFLLSFLIIAMVNAQQNIPFQENFSTEFNPALIKEGTFRYNAIYHSAEGGNRYVFIREVTAIETKGRKNFRVVERTINSEKESIDTVEYDAITLQPLRQRAIQNNNVVSFDFTNSTMKGMLKIDTTEYSIDLKLRNVILPGLSSAGLIIGTLPLKDDYSVQLEIFDLFTMSVRTFSVKVAGREKIVIDSKSHVTYRIEITPTDDAGIATLLWIGVKDKITYRIDTMLPLILGGGTTSAELQ